MANKQKLPQMLSIIYEMGQFEPKWNFLDLDAVDLIDILNDWLYDIEQYRRHLMTFQVIQMAKTEGDKRTLEQKLAAFREAGTQMGLSVPDGFEDFVEAHQGCKSMPIKPESCPVCNPQD